MEDEDSNDTFLTGQEVNDKKRHYSSSSDSCDSIIIENNDTDIYIPLKENKRPRVELSRHSPTNMEVDDSGSCRHNACDENRPRDRTNSEESSNMLNKNTANEKSNLKDSDKNNAAEDYHRDESHQENKKTRRAVKTTFQRASNWGSCPTRDPPTPVFEDYPIMLEHIEGPALSTLEWKIADILKGLINTVRSVKPLSPKKLLVGCVSALQQERALKIAKIGQTIVKANIPVPTTIGVVRGIPTHVSMEEFREKVQSGPPIKTATRLTLRNGSPSKAIKIVFESRDLPNLIEANYREYLIDPYVETVKHCFKCNKLGHIAKFCNAKTALCGACGRPGHTNQECKATRKRCTNCQGEHSASYLGCPARKRLTLANKIRAEKYIPKAIAIKKAKDILAERQAQLDAKKQSHQDENTKETDQHWRTNTYASRVRRNLPNTRPNPPRTPNKATEQVSETQKDEPPKETTSHKTTSLEDLVASLSSELKEIRQEIKALREENACLKKLLNLPGAHEAPETTDNTLRMSKRNSTSTSHANSQRKVSDTKSSPLTPEVRNRDKARRNSRSNSMIMPTMKNDGADVDSYYKTTKNGRHN